MQEINNSTPSTTIVVGATSGIGRALLEKLPSESRIVGVARTQQRLSELAATSAGSRLHLMTRACDVTDEEAVKNLFSSLTQNGEKIAGIVNCAGSVLLKPAHLTSLAEFDTTFNINVRSCFLLLKYGIPHFTANGGSIVFFSTAAVKAALANHDVIASAKAAVEGLTRAAAATYAPKQIRINAIAPGLVKTPLTERIHANTSAARASEAMHALGSLGEPAEIAELTAWLLSDSARWMTGQVIGFDGGLALRAKG